MAYLNPAAEKYIAEHPENEAYRRAYEAKVSASLRGGTAPTEGAPGKLPEALDFAPGESDVLGRGGAEPSGIPSSMLAEPGTQPAPAMPVHPPEWHPPPNPGVHPLHDFATSLPSSVGGGTEMWQEPSARDAMLATGNRNVKPGTPEYLKFADMAWNDAVAKAQQEGRGIVRVSKLPSNTIGSALKKGALEVAGDIPGAVAAAGLSAADTATAGLGTRLAPNLLDNAAPGHPTVADEVSAVQGEHPIGSFAGSVLGAMSPLGVPGLLGKGAASLGLGKAATGALQAGGTHLATGASQMGGDIAQGRPTLDVGDLLGGTLAAAGTGSLLGGLGGAAANSQKSLRSADPDIRVLEAAKGRISPRAILPFAKRLDVPKGIQSNFDEALIEGPEGARFPEDIAARKVVPGITKRITDRASALEDEWNGDFGGFMPKYLATPEGQVALPPKHLTNELLDVIAKRTHPGTTEKTPFTARDEFKSALNDAFEVSKPSLDPKGTLKTGGGAVLSVPEAKGKGFAIEGNYPKEYKVVVTPRAMNAQHFEEVVGALSALAKEGQTGVPDETMRRLVAAARSDRDAYPWPASLGPEPTARLDDGKVVRGFSAMHTKWHQKMAELESQMGRAGIRKTKDMRASELEPQVEASARRYGEKGARDLTSALHELAPEDVRGKLKEIPAVGAVERLNKRTEYLVPASPSRVAGSAHAARIRIDPLMGLLGRGLPRLAVPATTDQFRREVMGLFGPKPQSKQE